MTHLFRSAAHAAGGVKRLLFRIPRQRMLILLLVLCALCTPSVLHAQGLSFGEGVVVLIGEVVEFFVQLLGKLLVAVIDILVQVAQYNDFADSAAVNIGWVVARDIANMFFIIALVVISFGTILQWEQYRYNRLLGKLVITAVIVNFSKAITLFLIDFSQVIMLTFVNAFRDAAAGNLTTGFGIRALLTYANSATSVDINIEETVMIYALAVILILVALIVTLSLIVILVRRIISLWIIIILAPLAFVASVMPGGLGGYNSGWWKRLGSEMFIGPTLAFFLWLSFSVIFLTSGAGSESTASVITIAEDGTIIEGSQEQLQAVISEIGSTKNIFNFVATIVLLIHSMTIAQQAGGFAGKFAGRMSGLIDRGGAGLAKGIAKFPKKLSDVTGLTGAAKRVGYNVADAGLSAVQKIPFTDKNIPLIGGKIRRMRGRLNERRDYVDKDAMRYIASLKNEELSEISNGKAATMTGVMERRAAAEELMRRNKGHWITTKGMRNYLDSIGYSAQIEYDDKGNPLGVEENARYRPGLEQVFDARWKVPRLYDAIFGDTPNENEKKAIDAEFRSDLKKANKGDFLKMTLEGLQDGTKTPLVWEELQRRMEASQKFRDDMRRDATTPLGYVIDHEGKPFPQSTGQKRKDALERLDRLRQQLGLTDPKIDPAKAAEYAKAASKQELPAETDWQRTIKERLADTKDDKEKAKIVKGYEDFARDYKEEFGDMEETAKKPFVPEGKTAQEVTANAQKMIKQIEDDARKEIKGIQDKLSEDVQGIDNDIITNRMNFKALGEIEEVNKKMDKDRNRIGEETEKRLEEIEKEEIRKKAEAVRSRRPKPPSGESPLVDIPEGAQLDAEPPEFVAGRDVLSRLDAEQQRATEQDREATARFAADFEKLNLNNNFAGVNLTGTQKEQMIPKLQDMFRKQLEEEGELNQVQISKRVEQFGQQLGQAESIAIANTKRRGYTLGHVLRHENAHTEVDKLSDQDLQDVFNQIPETERNQMLSRVLGRWDFSGLSADDRQKEAVKEYLTEGLANYGRSDAVGEQLDPSLALALKSKGVRFRSYASVSEPSVGQGQSREELETSRRAMEQRLQAAESEYEERLNSIASNLPQGITPDALKNDNPLVQKDLREKGVSSELIGEVRNLNDSLRRERKQLGDIEREIAKQTAQTQQRGKELESTISKGLDREEKAASQSSEPAASRPQAQPKSPQADTTQNAEPPRQQPRQPEPPESTDQEA